jgi:two-component system nitrate/nitrite response regulator NarL
MSQGQAGGIEVLIIGGTPLVRSGLQHVLQTDGFAVEVSADDIGEFAASSAAMASPKLIIVDALSRDDQFILCGRLRQRFPESRLVLMADDCTLETVARGFDAGIDGYLVKATPCEAMLEALRLIMLGEKFMPVAAFSGLASLRGTGQGAVWKADAIGGRLSEREVEILACLARGEPNKRIAWHLDIAEATVKVHIKAILRKLQLGNRTQAAIWAIGHGLNGSPMGGADTLSAAESLR